MRISDWSSDVCSSDRAGAQSAGHVLLRLPNGLKDIWREWLQLHYPERAAHVMSLIRQMRGGKDYDVQFGRRMRGEGPFADLIAARFANAHRRRSDEHTSELQSLMRISYAGFCLKQNTTPET